MSLTQFQTFSDVRAHLNGLGLFHMNLGLERISNALQALGLLEKSYFPAVQIVGTNGKGSTATFLASLATAHGLKTGLYTSPHFLTARERIRINGEMLATKLWPDLATRVHSVAPDLTYFEFLTALALLAFDDAKVDLAVLESGLGGHYDATSAALVQLLCYTPISMDHENILGTTLLAIAEDKAGAIRVQPGGNAVLSGPQKAEVMDCLIRTAQAKGVPFYGVEWQVMPFDLLNPKISGSMPKLGMQGLHQIGNARLALAAWNFLCEKNGWTMTRPAVLRGLASAHIAGRLQSIPATQDHPPFLLDGAHNPHGITALANSLEYLKIKPRAIIFACLADKNRKDMIPILKNIAPSAPIFIPTIQHNERALKGETLAAEIAGAKACNDMQAALEEIKNISVEKDTDPILICGSLYLLSEFFALYPQYLD